MTDLELAKAARDRLSDPRNWCGEGPGLGASRCLVLTVVDVALGSEPVTRCDHLFNLLDDEARRRGARREYGNRPAARFNDTHSHAEVLSLLDDVIAKLGEQEYGTPLPSLPAVTA